MSEQAQPSPPLIALAGVIAQNVQILGIALNHAAIGRNTRPGDEVVQIKHGFSVRTQTDEVQAADGEKWTKISSFIHYHLRAFQPNSGASEDDPELRIEAEFRVDYRHDTSVPLVESILNAFSRLNGVYNSWPYWREFVQSTVGRMALPPLVLPVLTIGSLVKTIQEQDSADTASAKPSSAPSL